MSVAVSSESIETPVGVVDLDKVRANAARVASYADRQGLSWRPHVKTHKSREIARMQLAAGAHGLTVATLREAEVMSGVTDDLLLAYPPVGRAKLERLGGVVERAGLTIALDSSECLLGVAGVGTGTGRPIRCLIEVDVGLGRVGVSSPSDVVRLAEEARNSAGTSFSGILFYPGHIRMKRDEQLSDLEEVSRRLADVLGALADAGLTADVVSGGSTPTLWDSHRIEGLTEIRSGSCIFFDREAVDVGVAKESDVAYTVLTTVVSTAVSGQAVVDAGSKALAKEGRGGEGFGFVLDRPKVSIKALSEEHGILDLAATEWRPVIGDRVRIVPNHVCVSANLQDDLLAPDGNQYRTVRMEARGRGPWSD